MNTAPAQRVDRIEQLRKDRPRSRFLRWSLTGFVLLLVFSLFSGEFQLEHVFSAQRLRNLENFALEVLPPPIRRGEGLQAGLAWAGEILASPMGFEALGKTLAISILAILLAFFVALILTPPGTRSLACPEPFLPGLTSKRRALVLSWAATLFLTRFFYVFLRAIPEYIWAFILIQIFGLSAWPAIVALAIHNSGILGKLFSETVENLPSAPAIAMRGLGAGRAQIFCFALFPTGLSRFLVYFFYRWETCIRESTVLGMLGIVSLGYYIRDAQATINTPVMLFLILLGSGLVLIGDIFSALVRYLVRNSS